MCLPLAGASPALGRLSRVRDSALRELERRFRESGARIDEERYRQELLRSGRLAQQAEVVAAWAEARCGVTVLELVPYQPAPEGLDAAAAQAGYRALGSRWCELSRERAQEVLAALLHRDMAYRAETLPRTEAERIAGAFFELFGGPLRCYSNSDWEPDDPGGSLGVTSWDPISRATFDSGIVATDGVVTALFWFEDED